MIYYLTVTHSNGAVLVKYSNILRSSMHRLIKLDATSDLAIGSTSGTDRIYLNSMNTDPTNYKIQYPALTPSSSNSTH